MFCQPSAADAFLGDDVLDIVNTNSLLIKLTHGNMLI
jgi:hypothetical protein